MLLSSEASIFLVRRDRENYEVRIQSPNKWGAILVLCVAFALLSSFWVAFVLVPALFDGNPSRIGPGAAVSPILAVVFFAYLSRGNLLTETVAVRNGVLILRRRYLVLGKEESFRAEEVENLRHGGLDNGTIEFEARGKTHYLRNRLREETARILVEELSKRVGIDADS